MSPNPVRRSWTREWRPLLGKACNGSNSHGDLTSVCPTDVTPRRSRRQAPRRNADTLISVSQSNGHDVWILLSCKFYPHTPRPHFERSLAVRCWQTWHVVQQLRKSCPLPRQVLCLNFPKQSLRPADHEPAGDLNRDAAPKAALLSDTSETWQTHQVREHEDRKGNS